MSLTHKERTDAIATLEGALALLERGWCQSHLAMNEVGLPVEPDDRKAARWCISGAICATAARLFPLEGCRREQSKHGAYLFVCDHLDIRLIPEWNDEDGRTQSDVVSAVRAALTIARSTLVRQEV